MSVSAPTRASQRNLLTRMHLLTILAFAFLFWQAEQPGEWLLVAEDDLWWTLLVVGVQPAILGISAILAAGKARRLLLKHSETPELAQHFQHRTMALLRGVTGAGFAAAVFLTRWPEFFAFGRTTPALQIVGDVIVLTPFVVNLLILWLAAYPLERSAHADGLLTALDRAPSAGQGLRLGPYLGFHLRHYVLVVAVPMLLILFTSNMTRGYASWLEEWTGWMWTPDAVLGLVAVGVFVTAPAMLRHIWRTTPLEPGPIRERLEEACRRVGLRCREILLWHSDGIMINAAVMGVVAPLRFVLLSDVLLGTMNVRQIEAVFGHEAGHVRHRHIQYFLVFAVVGWLAVAGVMEFVASVLGNPNSTTGLPLIAVEGVGIGATAIVWGVGFGWLSRRFERQADLFGAYCVTPPAAECTLPCSVHPDDQTTLSGEERVCATGAAVFSSALDRVAVLNGIPLDERSWRHSSIGSRIRFLASLAADPGRAERFERMIRRVKTGLMFLAVVGSAFAAYYWMVIPEPAILRL